MRLFLAIAVASLSACALPAGPYSNTRWGFASTFPYSINEKSDPGDGITVSAANDADTIAYMLSVFPISGATLARKGPDRALEDAVRGAVDNVHGALLSKRDITFAGFPQAVRNRGQRNARGVPHLPRWRAHVPTDGDRGTPRLTADDRRCVPRRVQADRSACGSAGARVQAVDNRREESSG